MAGKAKVHTNTEMDSVMNLSSFKQTLGMMLATLDENFKITGDAIINFTIENGTAIFNIDIQTAEDIPYATVKGILETMRTTFFMVVSPDKVKQQAKIKQVSCAFNGQAETMSTAQALDSAIDDLEAMAAAAEEREHPKGEKLPEPPDPEDPEPEPKYKPLKSENVTVPPKIKEELTKMTPNYGKELKTRYTKKTAAAKVITRQAFLDDLANEAIEDSYTFNSIADAVSFLTQKYKLSMDEIKYLKKKAEAGKINFVEKRRENLDR